ncbi:Origin recognition complex subunit 1 [Neolecta irregularis DAH-3]|uniref:Origin recognition complex subunit 1 n=1 Tax=Neolecta irregularis (strain DAH-3) TaxID=1198029 RepID=A0A1U7LUV7_NEOID|nr:Origin recognition complex subunit 1 [Neolecta irregularis DAH-3]|eukprot:OLL26363.1 Origin recognition complex subunit 1 [Neolecta irregularis DAH-3]
MESSTSSSDEEPRTPRRRSQKRGIVKLPSKGTPSRSVSTPRNKPSVRKPLEITPLPLRTLTPNLVSSPHQIARANLHVSAVPASLPCRDEEFNAIYTQLESAISEGCGACIYVSGTPGTGKTATVKEVIRSLQLKVEEEKLVEFSFVEINGMRVTDPNQTYSILYEYLFGQRVTPAHAQTLLDKEFSRPNPERIPCVVLMDELDQLVTKKQTVLYNFFHWPTLIHSRLIVVAVANTMDLPERMLSNKISSRMGLVRIGFRGYTDKQLIEIIASRLKGISVMDEAAVRLAAGRVANVSGDARRALDICRRAVELAEPVDHDVQSTTTNDKKDILHKGTVTLAVINYAMVEMMRSPLQAYLKSLPLSQKVFLAALLSEFKRSGVAENSLGNISEQAGRICQAHSKNNSFKSILANSNRFPRLSGVMRIASVLSESGIVEMENKGSERSIKIRLRIPEEDVKMAYREDSMLKSMFL